MAEPIHLRSSSRHNSRTTGSPGESLRQAVTCLQSASQALEREGHQRADEVLGLLKAAANHLEQAWDEASGQRQADSRPPKGRV